MHTHCLPKHSSRFLLVAVNAKYIHSNLAVYSLQAYARARGFEADLAEYTINHRMEAVLRDLYARQPLGIGFSCYIWNMEFIEKLAWQVHQVLPEVPIWLGGPEVSWNPKECLERLPFVKGIMIGEGEETFAELLSAMEQGLSPEQVAGLCIRSEEEKILFTSPRELLSMDDLVFPYEDLSAWENRIIYYESSRGCPFSCSYCLSSVEKKLRFRSTELVLKELEFFLQRRPKQIKFVDRTFNCRQEHADTIWKYILEHDNGVTNFHFEISADLLKEEEFAMFEQMRPGLIQLEIGVQTTNPDTIAAIGRKMDLKKLARNTERVRRGHNIHQHLDLIAGLPWEGLESFRRSFNEVYAMKPDQLQLGFLKVLHGTRMEQEAGQYGLVYRRDPVYEVLYTRWLSFSEVLQLKDVEDMVERYYNSGQFSAVLTYGISFFDTPFDFFHQLGVDFRSRGLQDGSQGRVGQYQALRDFLLSDRWKSKKKETGHRPDPSWVEALLSYDFCLRERLKQKPDFIPDQEPYKKQISDFFAREISQGRWFGEEALQSSYRQLRGRCQPLIFKRNVLEFLQNPDTEETQSSDKLKEEYWLALFDYEKRSPLDHNARVIWIPGSQVE